MNQINFFQDQHQHLTDDDIDRAIIVWRSLLRTIVKRMKTGYNQAIKLSNATIHHVHLPIVTASTKSPIGARRDVTGVALPFRRLDIHARAAKISTML